MSHAIEIIIQNLNNYRLTFNRIRDKRDEAAKRIGEQVAKQISQQVVLGPDIKIDHSDDIDTITECNEELEYIVRESAMLKGRLVQAAQSFPVPEAPEVNDS